VSTKVIVAQAFSGPAHTGLISLRIGKHEVKMDPATARALSAEISQAAAFAVMETVFFDFHANVLKMGDKDARTTLDGLRTHRAALERATALDGDPTEV